jgi:hypothetical protein
MMTARPLTPELVERRLSELQQLSRLGASLAEAELPPIVRRQLERRSLCVVARAGASSRDARDVGLHVMPTVVDRQLGWMPDAWVDPANGLIVGAGLTMLVGAQVGERRCDALPRGHEATVTLRFLAARPICVDALPVLQRSDGCPRLWLSLLRDRLHTQW